MVPPRPASHGGSAWVPVPPLNTQLRGHGQGTQWKMVQGLELPPTQETCFNLLSPAWPRCSPRRDDLLLTFCFQLLKESLKQTKIFNSQELMLRNEKFLNFIHTGHRFFFLPSFYKHQNLTTIDIVLTLLEVLQVNLGII